MTQPRHKPDTTPTHHPLHCHPFASGVMVTPMEYDRLVRAAVHGVATVLAMNAVVGARRVEHLRRLYHPN